MTVPHIFQTSTHRQATNMYGFDSDPDSEDDEEYPGIALEIPPEVVCARMVGNKRKRDEDENTDNEMPPLCTSEDDVSSAVEPLLCVAARDKSPDKKKNNKKKKKKKKNNNKKKKQEPPPPAEKDKRVVAMEVTTRLRMDRVNDLVNYLPDEHSDLRPLAK